MTNLGTFDVAVDQGQEVTVARNWLLVAVRWSAPILLGCTDAPPASPRTAFFPVPGQSALPFSEAVRVGNILYLSGQLGTDTTGRLVPGGIRAETRQALMNIAAVLQRHGSSLDQVVKCTVMLADIGEWAAMNEVYLTFFRSHRPARSAFGTSGLALRARLELECTAALGTRT
jgi:2-iminobutanoate/2-iminopropanoate deaminase